MKNKPERKKESQRSMPPVDESDKVLPVDTNIFRHDLLVWYDKNRRILPWRAGRDKKPDPYHVWLSEIMLQQTIVVTVIPYFQKFVEKWATVQDLAAASQDDVLAAWAGLGYYARARNLHKCAGLIVTKYQGRFPEEQSVLKQLPGIGDYTSAAIASIAFDKPAIVIDGNVERVISRYFSLVTPLPISKPQIRKYATLLSEGRADRPGDCAQAMMDLGATVCTPQAPKCNLCPLEEKCLSRCKGIQTDLPYKIKKGKKPQKYCFIYWIKNNKGQVLLEKRKEKGLFGGMMALPCSGHFDEREKIEQDENFFMLDFSNSKPLIINHSFTHFDLEARGQFAAMDDDTEIDRARFLWVEEAALSNIGLPGLFKKFINALYHGTII